MIPQRIPDRYKYTPMIALTAGEREEALYTNFRTIERYATMRQHIVVDGETLQEIAIKYYGFPELWFVIMDHNPEVINHPYDNIVGKIIRIPNVNAGEY